MLEIKTLPSTIKYIIFSLRVSLARKYAYDKIYLDQLLKRANAKKIIFVIVLPIFHPTKNFDLQKENAKIFFSMLKLNFPVRIE